MHSPVALSALRFAIPEAAGDLNKLKRRIGTATISVLAPFPVALDPQMRRWCSATLKHQYLRPYPGAEIEMARGGEYFAAGGIFAYDEIRKETQRLRLNSPTVSRRG